MREKKKKGGKEKRYNSGQRKKEMRLEKIIKTEGREGKINQ